MRRGFVYEEATHLKRSGLSPFVISPVPYVPAFAAKTEKRRDYRDAPTHTVIDGIPVVFPRYFRLPGHRAHGVAGLTMYLAVRTSLREQIRQFRPHLLHAHTATPDGYAGLLLGRSLGLPVIVTFHGSDINVYPSRNRLTAHQTSKVILGADQTIAVSHALRRAAEQIARPCTETAVVYAGCDLAAYRYSEAARVALRGKLSIPPADPVLVIVANVLKTKGIFELMEAFSQEQQRHAGLRLLVVGDGGDAAVLRSMAEARQVADRVHFAGRRPRDEIQSWLSAGDIFVLPSWSEGLANAVIEAMACERPVVATRVGGIPEAVVDGVTGILVERDDEDALRRAIDGLIRDPEARARMGKAGRSVVEDRFRWEEHAQKLRTLYEGVL